MKKDLRIVFFGTPGFAVPALRALYTASLPIAAVVTAPDKPAGRRMTLTASPIKTLAQELDIPAHTPTTLKDEAFFETFSALQPDLCVVVAYGKLIPERYLAVPRLGFVNIHPSLLPAYRGPSPIQTALLDGCADTGVSLMLLDTEMDHGPVLAQQEWVIPEGADSAFCQDALATIGAELLIKTLPGYVQGATIPHPQEHDRATITKKFERADGRLDWTLPAIQISNRIRALAANPGTWTTWSGKTLNIFNAHPIVVSLAAYPTGTVFLHDGQLAVACGGGALVIETLQLEGTTRQSAHEFLNGRPTLIGARLD